jgi:hypothetical protein
VIQPLHQIEILAMGQWILDDANLEDIAEACAKRNRWEFMLSVAPLKLTNTTEYPSIP